MTEKVLIINFKRIGDLISSLMSQADYENKEIHVLCYREITAIEKSIRKDVHFHYINRHQIEFLLKSPLFNDAFAIQEMNNSIQELQQIEWDEIINYSNDNLGARLVNIFKGQQTKLSGIYYENNRLKHAGSWEIVYNNVLSESKINPINLKDVFSRMVGTDSRGEEASFLRRSKKHLEMVEKNFEILREKYSQFGVPAQLIGIAPFASTLTKSISVDETVKLIKTIKDKQSHQVPVLIHAPIETEKFKVNEIAQHFNGQLVTIEADLLALNAVLSNIDFLIAPDTATIHYANELNTTSVMVANGEAPLFLQGTSNAGDLVVTNINLNELNHSGSQVESDEIYSALQILSSPAKNVELDRFKSRLYLVNQDEFGTFYMQLTGQKDFTLGELKRDIARNYFSRSFYDRPLSINVSPNIIEVKASDAYLEAEKLNVFRITKNVLTCLRLAKATSTEGQKQFIETLNEIIENVESDRSLTSLPVMMFYQEISQAEFPNKEEHLKFFEKKLFKLKNDLQILFSLYKDYHSFVISQKARASQKSIRSTEVNA